MQHGSWAKSLSSDLTAAEPVAAQAEVAAPDPLPEPYSSLFKQAKEAPTEFNTWTSLISAAEKLVRLSCLLMLGLLCSFAGSAVVDAASLGARNVGGLLFDAC